MSFFGLTTQAMSCSKSTASSGSMASVDHCTVCQAEVAVGFKYWTCHHSFHLDCIVHWRGKSCPLCRAPWRTEDEHAYRLLCQFRGIHSSPRPAPVAVGNRMEREDRQPNDLIVLCCRRVGPPPDFQLSRRRSTVFSIQRQMYECQTCHNSISRPG